MLNNIISGNDAVFLPGKIHGCEEQLYVIYLNQNANDGKGSFEIEILDAPRILKCFSDVNGNVEDFFGELPVYYHGEWKYSNKGDSDFDELYEAYQNADFIVGRDGSPFEEMIFLVKWALSKISNN